VTSAKSDAHSAAARATRAAALAPVDPATLALIQKAPVRQHGRDLYAVLDAAGFTCRRRERGSALCSCPGSVRASLSAVVVVRLDSASRSVIFYSSNVPSRYRTGFRRQRPRPDRCGRPSKDQRTFTCTTRAPPCLDVAVWSVSRRRSRGGKSKASALASHGMARGSTTIGASSGEFKASGAHVGERLHGPVPR
jgi:hypothetical protein